MNHFFKQLNRDLKQSADALPQLIIDGQALEQNLQYAATKFKYATHLHPRLVVKSLACMELLKMVSAKLTTHRFMVFHLPQLLPILENFSDPDILLGKPMPVGLVQQFYIQHPQLKHANIQWLVDTKARLLQYLEVAKVLEIQLQINIEIDVGLHRGGVDSKAQMIDLLRLIEQYPDNLKFSGLMGYDAHVTKLPSVIKKVEVAYQESQATYQRYKDIIQQQFPQLWHAHLCFNGGGSPTFYLHVKQSVCNDLAFGSMLLKPSDFDSDGLRVLKACLWIATPVLKVLPYSQLPGLPMLNKLPHRSKALFVYGGYWMADYVYPQGIHPHVLYGRSTNQEMVNVPKTTHIEVDDFVFLRPTQSEAIIPQFAQVTYYLDRSFKKWESFRE